MKLFVGLLALLLAISVYKTYVVKPPVEGAAVESHGISGENLSKLTAASQSGDRFAQYKLGLLYARGGIGSNPDFKKAHELLLKSAMQGVPKAQYHLGEMYVRGDGVEENFEEATVWFWLATSLGDVYSQKRLRALNTRISNEELANAKARVDRLWKKIPHDLNADKSLH